ncbi:MAG: DUF366 family protein [Bdellovibrionota bacterium]
MSILSIRFLEETRAYTGIELRPHFLLTEIGLRGSAMAAFIGPCDVSTENLVDWEDRLANDYISAAKMLHFIGEFFGMSLREGVFLQRLLMSMLTEMICGEVNKKPKLFCEVFRVGDDIFLRDGSASSTKERKLSVSIVTASPVSQLLHVGLNIDPTGAPVAAVGLDELGIPPDKLALSALERFSSELTSCDWACAKVRPVM